MFNFPAAAFVGQKYQPAAGMPVYVWDGQKWTTFTPALASKVAASNANPVVDGVAATGSSPAYARGDHVHPLDASRAPVANPTFTGTLTASLLSVSGNMTVNGKVTSSKKGHKFGYARGTAMTGGVTQADANIKLYDHTGGVNGGSWAGVGTDTNGNIWVRTGYSGNPAPIFYIQNDQQVVFRTSPYMPTPGPSDNSTRIATTEFVMARKPTGVMPLDCTQGSITGNVTQTNADLWVHNRGNYGVLYLGNTGGRYVIWDGSNYSFSGAHVYAANGRLWGTGDYDPAGLYTNVRLAYVGDPSHPQNTGLSEPYNGCTQTGHAGQVSWQTRYRQFQYYTTGWFAIGYA